LRAFGKDGIRPFEQVLASRVANVLYIPELELVWYKVEDRLWVIDTRALGPGKPEPVLIARGVPLVGGMRVERGGERFTEPDDAGDDEEDLRLHWDAEPWLEGGEERKRIDHLDGRAWLARERRRSVRPVPPLQRFAAGGQRVALPAHPAQCDDPQICGAAVPFGRSGWQLLVAHEDHAGDFPEYACLFHDARTDAFATPPEARSWGPAGEAPSGSCGPYAFNADGTVYLAENVVCKVGLACATLRGGIGIGWLEPGVMVGSH
jgi:hypothetical protein